MSAQSRNNPAPERGAGSDASDIPPRRLTAALASRVDSIDVVRGAAMILMAIDHVRVFAGIPAGGPTPGIFFTRWVTHFCAPVFVFLAGTSAFLSARKGGDLSRFLLIRGALLVLLELTFFRVAWTFNFDFAHYEMAGVIWVLGWCMILMAGLVRLPLAVGGTFGIVVIAAHNLMDPHVGTILGSIDNDPLAALWKVLYLAFFAGPIRMGEDGPNLIVLYTIVPWIGVMAAGYAFGRILTLEPARRRRACLALGLGATAAFLVLRGINLYGDPRPWSGAAVASDDAVAMPAAFSFLNTTKYPASLDFLLMTLGPAIALIGLLEGVKGPLWRWISVFGRVPFFFYILHIPLIHALALVVSMVRDGRVNPWLFENHPMGNPPPPDGYMWSLPTLYLVWAVAIAILYFPCRWFAGVKARRRDWWLSYL